MSIHGQLLSRQLNIFSLTSLPIGLKHYGIGFEEDGAEFVIEVAPAGLVNALIAGRVSKVKKVHIQKWPKYKIERMNTARTPDEIAKFAASFVGRAFTFHAFDSNCEAFARYCIIADHTLSVFEALVRKNPFLIACRDTRASPSLPQRSETPKFLTMSNVGMIAYFGTIRILKIVEKNRKLKKAHAAHLERSHGSKIHQRNLMLSDSSESDEGNDAEESDSDASSNALVTVAIPM